MIDDVQLLGEGGLQDRLFRLHIPLNRLGFPESMGFLLGLLKEDEGRTGWLGGVTWQKKS